MSKEKKKASTDVTSIDADLQNFKKSMKSKRDLESMITGDIDLRNEEKRFSKKSKQIDSSDSEGLVEEMSIQSPIPEKKTRRRRRGILRDKRNEKKSADYISKELSENIIEPAKERAQTKVVKRSVDTGHKMKSKGTDRFNNRESLTDWVRGFYNNVNRTPDEVKKSIIDSLSKNIDNATTTNNDLKPEEKKRKLAFDPEKDKESFFAYDKNDELFGLANPFTYKIYDMLLKDFQRREELYRKEGREVIIKKLQSLKFPDPEKCNMAHCHEFLREPKGKERPCRRMDECICMLLASSYPDSVEIVRPEEGFIAREFLLPSEKETFEQRGVLPEEPQLCLLCKRLEITFLHYYYSSNDIEPVEIIQDHQNEIGKAGEYASQFCINPVIGKKRTGIVAPIVKFAAHDYVYGRTNINGYHEPVKCLFETNLGFFFSPNLQN
jgi:hypothetical protein